MAAAQVLEDRRVQHMIYTDETIDDLLYESKLTRAFISLPKTTNVDFDYDDTRFRPQSKQVFEERYAQIKRIRRSGTRKKIQNSRPLFRRSSINANVTPNTVNDVRIATSLQETFKFYFKYPELTHTPNSNINAENALRAGENRAPSTYRSSPESHKQTKIRTQVSKMRDSINFAQDKIRPDIIFVFDGNNMTNTQESFFSYFDQNLFGKKNLCIDGQNIGNSMKESQTTNVKYIVIDPISKTSDIQTSDFKDLFFDKHHTPTSPLSNIKSFRNRSANGNAKNIYGITYNVVCKLIDLLSGCNEELQFDNYVITIQRHSILDFFWSINTDPANEARITSLETIGGIGSESPICIKYEHGEKIFILFHYQMIQMLQVLLVLKVMII